MQYLIPFVIGCAAPNWTWFWRSLAIFLVGWNVVIVTALVRGFDPATSDRPGEYLIGFFAGKLIVDLLAGVVLAAIGRGLRLFLRPPSAYEKTPEPAVSAPQDAHASPGAAAASRSVLDPKS